MNHSHRNWINHGQQRSASLFMAGVMAYFLMLPIAGATMICRWMDENGQVQFADVVPDRYKSIVMCRRLPAPELSSELPSERNRLVELFKHPDTQSSPPRQAASSAAATPAAGLPPAVKQPMETVNESTDCKTWWRLFNESGSCFAPFRTTHGGVKAEAFDHCIDIASPEEKCGPPSN